MKHLKNSLMSVLCVLASVMAFTACSTEDVVDAVMGNDEYYIVLENVQTNLIDANGNLLTQQLYDDFQFDKGGKSASLGKSDAAPIKAFEKSCENVQSELSKALSGNLPEGGWVRYTFSLRKDSPTGKLQMEKSITIQ